MLGDDVSMLIASNLNGIVKRTKLFLKDRLNHEDMNVRKFNL